MGAIKVLRPFVDTRAAYNFRRSFMAVLLAKAPRSQYHSGQQKDQATNHARRWPTLDVVVPEPNDYISATKWSIWARPVLKWNVISTQKRRIHTDCEDTKRDDKTSRMKCRKTYTNRHGEEILFTPCHPPPGYVFVPSGIPSITGRCRKLARKLFVIYRPESGNKLATPIGLYVPEDVSEKFQHEFDADRARLGTWLWQDLGKKYPKMPAADKAELHDLILSQHPTIVGKKALRYYDAIISAHIRNRYTTFKSLATFGAIARVEEILATWRGEGLTEKESGKSRARMERKAQKFTANERTGRD